MRLHDVVLNNRHINQNNNDWLTAAARLVCCLVGSPADWLVDFACVLLINFKLINRFPSLSFQFRCMVVAIPPPRPACTTTVCYLSVQF